jgi:hypothetical protein
VTAILILGPFAVILAVLTLAGSRRDHREPVTVPVPERIAVVTTVPARDTAAFAHDNGLAIDSPDEGDEDS